MKQIKKLLVLVIALALIIGTFPKEVYAASKTIVVTSQKELNKALKSGKYTKITISNVEGKITIPKGDYSNISLVINAPNATIKNKAVTKKITINDAKKFTEFAQNNTISIKDDKLTFQTDAKAEIKLLGVAKEGADVKIVNKGAVEKVNISKNSNVKITQNGTLDKLVLKTEATVNLDGSTETSTAVVINKKAGGASISTSISVEVETNANATIGLEKGAEGSKIDIKSTKASVEVQNDTEDKVEISKANNKVETVDSGEDLQIKNNTVKPAEKTPDEEKDSSSTEDPDTTSTPSDTSGKSDETLSAGSSSDNVSVNGSTGKDGSDSTSSGVTGGSGSSGTEGQSSSGTEGQSSSGTEGQSSSGTEGQSSSETEGQSSSGTEGQSSSGTEGQSTSGTEGQSSSGTEGQSSSGTEGQSSSGTEGQSSSGTEGQSSSGTEGQSSSGTEGQSSSGTEGQSSSGTEGQSSSGTEGQSTSGTEGQSSSGTEGQSDRNLRKFVLKVKTVHNTYLDLIVSIQEHGLIESIADQQGNLYYNGAILEMGNTYIVNLNCDAPGEYYCIEKKNNVIEKGGAMSSSSSFRVYINASYLTYSNGDVSYNDLADDGAMHVDFELIPVNTMCTVTFPAPEHGNVKFYNFSDYRNPVEMQSGDRVPIGTRMKVLSSLSDDGYLMKDLKFKRPGDGDWSKNTLQSVSDTEVLNDEIIILSDLEYSYEYTSKVFVIRCPHQVQYPSIYYTYPNGALGFAGAFKTSDYGATSISHNGILAINDNTNHIKLDFYRSILDYHLVSMKVDGVEMITSYDGVKIEFDVAENARRIEVVADFWGKTAVVTGSAISTLSVINYKDNEQVMDYTINGSVIELNGTPVADGSFYTLDMRNCDATLITENNVKKILEKLPGVKFVMLPGQIDITGWDQSVVTYEKLP